MIDKKLELENKRHSLAHLLAAAVLDIWPGTKRAIGPAIDNGFYFDFEFPHEVKINDQDLSKIQNKMLEILPTWDKFERHELSADEAKLEYPGNQYKHELIDEFSKVGEKLSFYKSGSYWDLCRGGHAESMKQVDPQSFKIWKISQAYWRGNERGPQLTRIYGLAFETKKNLEDYLFFLEEAEKRDHKKLGVNLGLFMFHETAPGMPYWLPKGVVILNELINFWREEHTLRDYKEIISPLINKKELYITSGHFEHYWSDMFVAKTDEGEEYGLKAMNCPNAMIVFGHGLHSYKDLPLRLSDTDPLHRNERSGVLNGLFRVREFRQDDAHIFVTEDMISDEFKAVFDIVERFYSIFGLDYRFRLGTRPQSHMGDIETWHQAEIILKEILANSGREYSIAEGDGAFYGPKIDILMKDALGRDWQMGTVQLDFQQPKRFNLSYVAADGSRKTPIAIHRVIYGSLERFIGILIEHFNGAFPVWLAPLQVAVLPISDEILDYAKGINEALKAQNIRIYFDTRSESIGKKIREAEKQKIPYMLIVGKKEAENKNISVRQRGEKDLGGMSVDDVISRLKNEISQKSL